MEIAHRHRVFDSMGGAKLSLSVVSGVDVLDVLARFADVQALDSFRHGFPAGSAAALPAGARVVLVNCGLERPVAAAVVNADGDDRQRGRLLLEQQFDLTGLRARSARVMELCSMYTDPAYRDGRALRLLWHGIGRLMVFHRIDFLAGGVAIPLSRGDCYIRSVMGSVFPQHRLPPELGVRARIPLPTLDGVPASAVRLPSMLRVALRAGAQVGDQPYWDASRNTINLFLLLGRGRLDPRYARRFVGYA